MIKLIDNIYNHGFHIIDNFLDEASFQQLRQRAELLHAQGHFKLAKVGNSLNRAQHSDIRKDSICWLDEEPGDDLLCKYFNKIQELAKKINSNLYLGLIDFEAQFSIYQPGSFYRKHVDQFKNTQDRRISCVYYLNKKWQESFAGQLKLYDKDNQILAEVFPEANRFICFNSDLPHEVCETKELRYSIAGWMKTRSR